MRRSPAGPASAPLEVAAGVLALGAVVVAVIGTARRDQPLSDPVPLLVLGGLFVVAGVVASHRRPGNLSGRLLTATGLAWMASAALTPVENRVASTVGLALFPLGLAPLGHLAVTFPTGRASSRLERCLVVAPYLLAAASIPIVRDESCPECQLSAAGLDTERGLGGAWYAALLVAVLVTSFAVLALLARRWRNASRAARRVLLPVLPGACVFAAIYIVALLGELGLPTGLGSLWAVVGVTLLAAAPVVFLAGLLRARLASGGVGRLVVDLGGGGGAASHGLRDALAGALGDPSLEVAFWSPEQDGYVDADGAAVVLPPGESNRAVALIERGGRRVGALVYDPALREDPALVDAVSAAAGLALENERLHAEVLARLEEVRSSRARIVEAADAARRRVERDLHDGAQQRLVSLSLAVGMARSRLDARADPELDELLRMASDEARLALHELRSLAQGLHPSVLREAGLAAAVEALAERAPQPVDVTLEVDGPVPPAVETAAYFVISEALTNAAKHARASAVAVHVHRDGNKLLVEVVDDGVGGAHIARGSGLEGLADRVAAVDGRLGLDSPLGRGTRLWVELPCG